MLIETDRFLLRFLVPDDANLNYLGWLQNDESNKWILTKNQITSLSSLQDYIQSMTEKNNLVFFGIFDKYKKKHIGNIKYDSIDSSRSVATLGILIGDKAYRRKGVFQEVFKATANWIKEKYNIKSIVLGVDSKNIAAINAYQKSGFYIYSSCYEKNRAISKMRCDV